MSMNLRYEWLKLKRDRAYWSITVVLGLVTAFAVGNGLLRYRDLKRTTEKVLAEDQARRKSAMHMADWVVKLDAFLQFNERNILKHAGKVSHQLAEQHARGEFAKFEERRRQLEAQQPTSDFDKAVNHVKRLGQKQPKKLPVAGPSPKRPRRKPKDKGVDDGR